MDTFMRVDGYEIEEVHLFPSIDRWVDESGEHNNCACFENL